MVIRINITFSIPSSLVMDDLKRALNQGRFFIEKITPTTPVGHEISAYIMTGIFRGEWHELFQEWHRASVEAAIQEAILKEDQKEE